MRLIDLQFINDMLKETTRPVLVVAYVSLHNLYEIDKLTIN